MILRVRPFPFLRATCFEMINHSAVIRRTIPWELIDDSIYPNEYLHAVVDSMEDSLRQFQLTSSN